jgi:hypothetical protein
MTRLSGSTSKRSRLKASWGDSEDKSAFVLGCARACVMSGPPSDMSTSSAMVRAQLDGRVPHAEHQMRC